jgi:hypothetical protein
MEEDALSTLTDSLAAVLNGLANGFIAYSFSPGRIRSTNVSARRKE